ncbi:MAG: glycosyltransferase family 4 protein [Verrucomicrobiota bacterium]
MTRAIVIHADHRRPWLAARSVRSLKAAGIGDVFIGDGLEGESPVLLLRAGLVLNNPTTFRALPGTGNRVGVGLPVRWDAENPWSRFHALHGGDYPGLDLLPPPACEWHSTGNTAAARLRGLYADVSPRVVHWSPIDHAPEDERLFVMEIVTSLQQGGAERIARDLAWHLPDHGIRSRLVSLGKPHRSALQAPPDTLDLSEWNRGERAAVLAEMAVATGVDVLHVHLTDAAETRAVAASGIPVMATVHNARAGWPRDWQLLERGDVGLLLACSQAVEAELRESLPGIPARTVWNGIQPDEFPDLTRVRTGNEFTLACVANPRPQKRLELLPAILAATRDELISRGVSNASVRLVIAGETGANLPDAIASRNAVDSAAEKHGVAIRWTEGKQAVRDVLEQADAMVSCSAHEGLSLAHLEGISSGLPVIACDTGGTRELAWRNPAVTLLSADASADDFARALADVLLDPPPSGHPLIWRDFTTDRMTRRVAMLARQVACRPPEAATTIWFVTNNLSTGGAQSSLRRLAKSLHHGGQRVRVALLQEYPEHPTPGRLDLIRAGINVFVPPPAGMIEPEQAVDLILAEMAADPPVSVAYWNVIMIHKVLLAGALPFTRVFDISPGEMWFSAMERFMEDPPPGIPCRMAADYGRLLAGIVVKYAAESQRAIALGVRVQAIPNGVTLPVGSVAFKAGTPVVFGTAARISPQKRLDELIEAFRLALPSLPGAVFLIAGGVETGADECAANLREISLGLPVEWLGEIHDLAEFHQACDVFVMNSEPAGCPNASLEALAAGLPVIATDVGGASEQVIDGVNGRLVPARDAIAFSQAMIELAADYKMREAMGVAARDHIRRHFTLERMTADYISLLCHDFGKDATTSS